MNFSTTSSVSSTSCSNSIADSEITDSAAKIGAPVRTASARASDGREVEIDSRPSDALALAVRTKAPIFAAEDVIAESAIEFEHEVEDTEEVVDKFKEFLDRVTPEDFAGGDT